MGTVSVLWTTRFWTRLQDAHLQDHVDHSEVKGQAVSDSCCGDAKQLSLEGSEDVGGYRRNTMVRRPSV